MSMPVTSSPGKEIGGGSTRRRGPCPSAPRALPRSPPCPSRSTAASHGRAVPRPSLLQGPGDPHRASAPPCLLPFPRRQPPRGIATIVPDRVFCGTPPPTRITRNAALLLRSEGSVAGERLIDHGPAGF